MGDCDILPPHPLPDYCAFVEIVPEVRQTERESRWFIFLYFVYSWLISTVLFYCGQSEDESGSQLQEYSGFQEEGKSVTSAREASLLCNQNCALAARSTPHTGAHCDISDLFFSFPNFIYLEREYLGRMESVSVGSCPWRAENQGITHSLTHSQAGTTGGFQLVF